MKYLFYILPIFLNLPCFAQLFTVNPKRLEIPQDTFLLYQDSLNIVEMASLEQDSMTYTHYFETEKSYNLIYHEKGKLTSTKHTYALSIHSKNDTTLLVRLLKENSSQWIVQDSLELKNIQFSPAYFSSTYTDYNADGTNDVYFVFYHSMGISYSYGYIILISKRKNTLTLIENTLDIPNLEIRNGKITSITYSHPNNDFTSFTKTETFKIKGNMLKLTSSKKQYDK